MRRICAAAGTKAVTTPSNCGGRWGGRGSPASRRAGGGLPPAGADPTGPGEGAGKGARDRSVPAHPSPRTVVWWLLGAREVLTEEQVAFLERLKAGCPKIELAQSLAREFFTMVRQRTPERLEGWIERARTSGME